MIKFFKIATPLLIAAAMPLASASAATTVPYTFTTTGAMNDNGAYGNTIQFTAGSGPSALKMNVTGWQSKQSTDDITTAYVGAYSAGIGVTGINDTNGANAYHQIDNAFGYTDFVLLQFSRAVTLSSVNLNVFQMTNISGKDSDLSYYNAGSIVSAAWDSSINLTAYDTVPSTWTNVAGTGTDGSKTLSAVGAASTKWLVGAAILSTSGHDDGFKISSISVNEVVPTVPEPATWAMMLIGFCAIGAAMRRAVRKSEENFTARVRGYAGGELV